MSGTTDQRFASIGADPMARAMMCAPLVKLGRHADAYAVGRAALAAAPGDMAVQAVVHGALSQHVAPFHHRMLRDEVRNACYAQAIAVAVRPGMRVLEIGTGSGLLAMLAARAGAQVVTCEADPLIAAAAQAVVELNGLADRVTVVSKHSGALEVGVDLPERCDLFVSELFGANLFEENAVTSINDARARLLTPDAPIVPPRAEVRCALVRFDGLHDRGLADVLGFDLSPFDPLTRLHASLPSLARDGVALRSAAVAALPTDFTAPVDPGRRERVRLISDGGRVDGVAHWIRLDFGGGLVYENAPFGDRTAHWGIAVEPLPAPHDTVQGEAVAIELRAMGSQLLLRTIG